MVAVFVQRTLVSMDTIFCSQKEEWTVNKLWLDIPVNTREHMWTDQTVQDKREYLFMLFDWLFIHFAT